MKNAFATIQQAQGYTSPWLSAIKVTLPVMLSNPLGEHLLSASDMQGQRGPLG